MDKPSADAIWIAAATLAAEFNRQASLRGTPAMPNYDSMAKTFDQFVQLLEKRAGH